MDGCCIRITVSTAHSTTIVKAGLIVDRCAGLVLDTPAGFQLLSWWHDFTPPWSVKRNSPMGMRGFLCRFSGGVPVISYLACETTSIDAPGRTISMSRDISVGLSVTSLTPSRMAYPDFDAPASSAEAPRAPMSPASLRFLSL